MAKSILPNSLLRDNTSNEPWKFKHGHGRRKNRPASPEYSAYMSAKTRCTVRTDKSYFRYGGRGIEFRFTSFEEFLTHIGNRPSSEFSLDRIDVHGHYEIGNVRWATRSRQQNNKTNNHYTTFDGETLTDCEWASRLGLARNTVRERFGSGWCVPCAVTLPKRSGCNHRTDRARKARYVTYKGETLTVSQWTTRLGLTRGLLKTRLDAGWQIEKALTCPIQGIV